MVKQNILNLNLTSGETVTQVWTFDRVVAVLTSNNTLQFYEKALVAGHLVEPLTFSQPNYLEILQVMDFTQGPTYNELVMIGLSPQFIYKYVFTYQQASQSVVLDSLIFTEDSKLNGQLYTLLISDAEIFTACADCSQAFLSISGTDLIEQEYQTLS